MTIKRDEICETLLLSENHMMKYIFLVTCALFSVVSLVNTQGPNPAESVDSFVAHRPCREYSIVGKCPPGDNHHWTDWFDEDNPNLDDIESFYAIKRKFGICRLNSRPSAIEIRTVLGHHPYTTTPNVLQIYLFQSRCIASEQPIINNKRCPCKDFRVRFCCEGRKPAPTGQVGRCPFVNTYWTGWLDRDDPTATGDWENRFPYYRCICGGRTPLAIQARVKGSNLHYELTDDFVHIDSNLGFWCINREQLGYPTSPYPQCSEYEVRYCCPRRFVIASSDELRPAPPTCQAFTGDLNRDT